MKQIARALRPDLSRCLRSPLFFLTVLATAGLLLAGVWQEIRLLDVNGYDRGDVLYFHVLQEFPISGIFLAALPFSAAFCTEWRYRFARYGMQRSSVSAYAWAKILAAALCGALAVALGMTLYFLALAVRYPLMGYEGVLNTYSGIQPFGPLLLGPYPVLYFVCRVVAEGLGAMIYAAVAMAISGFIPNLFVALSSPILFFYLVINAIPATIGSIPLWKLNPLYIYMNMTVDMGGIAVTLLYMVGYSLLWVLALGLLFQIGVKRRIVHG